MIPFPKLPPVRSRPLRNSAMGQQCTLRIPNVCNFDSDTVTLLHPPVANGGMSTKGSDDAGAFGCSDCHDCVDRRAHKSVPRELVYECWIRGHQETVAMWRELGLISVKGAA